MELKINEFQLPEQILFNYEELKQELTEKVKMYETLVYTDDQIKEAKADKANLNKLKKALNDERIRREREYMEPFMDFKNKIVEIISIIDKPVMLIDKQVKAFEEKKKQDKTDAITNSFNAMEHPEWLHISQIMNEKWLNASTSMKSIVDSMALKLEKIEDDLLTLSKLPEFGFEATQVYKSTLDINMALAEGQKMAEIQKQKAEAARAKEEADVVEDIQKKIDEAGEEPEPPKAIVQDSKFTLEEVEHPLKQWVGFQALLSTEDAIALKEFFNSRNIEFKAV